ncbi:TonB-dependent receptor [Larkinella sp. VNQ87]|uniref:TonB-dependent receptor n=1 Tax=Larkinella sp. VNQ87 TaxID=3400921 RepID=UPI003BFEDFD6
MTFTLASLFCVLSAFPLLAQHPLTLLGTVSESGGRQPLSGVHLMVLPNQIGLVTNASGQYSITLQSKDSLTLVFSHVGYKTVTITTVPAAGKQIDVELTPGTTLAEVSVKSRLAGPKESDSPQLGRIEVPMAQLSKIPALLGEKDVLKVIQLLPGVQKASEGNAGVYVRGGGPDQNLITVDEAVVYNPSHLLGFFSVFNGDALNRVELTKGGFPARYGGRLSSVIEMGMKEGDKNGFHGTGSIGLIASRLTLEGPLQKGRSSFLVAARQCYLGLLTQMVAPAPESGIPSRSGFGDYNAKFSFELGPRDQLTIGGYTGSDQFQTQRLSGDHTLEAGLNWGNTTGTLRWNHRFNRRVSAHTSLIYSQYRMQVANEEVLNTASSGQAGMAFWLSYRSGIRDFSFKHDLNVYAGLAHQFRVGVQVTTHRFTPSAVVAASSETGSPLLDSRQHINVVESGVYAEDFWQPTERWRINGGLRISHFLHENGQYIRPEPRLSVAYKFPANWTVKGAYAQMNQYVHMLSSSGIGLPADLWVPVTDRVKPQQSEQWALGLAKDFKSDVALTVEGYYKTMTDNITYREGASFLLVDPSATGGKTRWEDNVTAGRGWSYGAEVMLQKKTGRLSGWMGYTLSWTQWQFAGLNDGRKFFPRYDRRHDFSLVGVYELSRRITVSGTWVYGTGQALTIPMSRYSVSANNPAPNSNPFTDTHNVKDYGERNSFRAEAYHRMDFGLQYHVRRKNREGIWEVSVYNAYNRRNPFYYSLEGKVETDGKPSKSVLYRYSLFPVIPTVSYTFKF